MDLDLDEAPESPYNKESNPRVNSKKKGNRWELQLTKILGEIFGDEFRRVPMSGAFCGGINRFRNQSVNQDAKNALTGDLIVPTWFPFSVEAKNYEDSPKMHNLLSIGDKDLDKWIEQAKEESKMSKRDWIVIFNITSKRRSFVAVDYKKFLEVTKSSLSSSIVYKDTIIFDMEDFLNKMAIYYFPENWREIRDSNKIKNI